MELLDYLPQRHRVTIVGKTQQAMQPILDAEEAAREDILAQLWPETATWGLKLWETALGLVTPEEPDAVRRSRVIAKLRGMGSVTPELIRQVAESYARGEVAVTEVPREYRVILTFVNQIGRPDGLDTLKDALAEIIPAHLVLEYVWRYRTWGECSRKTWAELSGITWQQAKEGPLP